MPTIRTLPIPMQPPSIGVSISSVLLGLLRQSLSDDVVREQKGTTGRDAVVDRAAGGISWYEWHWVDACSVFLSLVFLMPLFSCALKVYHDRTNLVAQWSPWMFLDNEELTSRESIVNRKDRFPFQLHFMLEKTAEESNSLSDIIEWLPHGRAFKIRDKKRLACEILPLFFYGQTRFGSFQRQLNLYGFMQLVGHHSDKGAYYHEYFLRGLPLLCHSVERVVHAESSRRRTKDHSSEPKLSNMEPFWPKFIAYRAVAYAREILGAHCPHDRKLTHWMVDVPPSVVAPESDAICPLDFSKPLRLGANDNVRLHSEIVEPNIHAADEAKISTFATKSMRIDPSLLRTLQWDPIVKNKCPN